MFDNNIISKLNLNVISTKDNIIIFSKKNKYKILFIEENNTQFLEYNVFKRYHKIACSFKIEYYFIIRKIYKDYYIFNLNDVDYINIIDNESDIYLMKLKNKKL